MTPTRPGTGAVDSAALRASRLRAGSLGRRFVVEDLDDVLRAGALAYSGEYSGAFPFMVMMRRVSHQALSPAQCVGVLNCLRAEVLRGGPRDHVDIAGVPDGCYAVANLGGGISFFRFTRAAAGPRAGWVIVEQMTGHELRPRGHQRPGLSYRGLLAELVAEVAADPYGAAARYGRERRTCGVCGHQLTAAGSRDRGVGPVCGARLVAAHACDSADTRLGIPLSTREGQ